MCLLRLLPVYLPVCVSENMRFCSSSWKSVEWSQWALCCFELKGPSWVCRPGKQIRSHTQRHFDSRLSKTNALLVRYQNLLAFLLKFSLKGSPVKNKERKTEWSFMQTKQSFSYINKPNAWILESKVNSGEQEGDERLFMYFLHVWGRWQ